MNSFFFTSNLSFGHQPKKTIFQTNKARLGFFEEEATHYNVTTYKGVTIYLEGCIYNISEDNLKTILIDIIKEESRANQEKKIIKLVEQADGEFIIHLFDENLGVSLIIADKYARLPLYYSANKEHFIVSRNLNIILDFLPEIELDTYALEEFINFEFFLGKKTLFKTVFKTEPYEFIRIDFVHNNPSLKITSLGNLSFDSIHWKNKSTFLKNYYSKFDASVKNRLNYFSEKNISISNTLSGGFDSRAIYGELFKLKAPVNHYTFEYIQDESKVGHKLRSAFQDKNYYEKLSFENKFDFNLSRQHIFNCQGMTNLYTAMICTQDNAFLAGKVNDTSVWGGFGGEYIRHPFKILYSTFFETLRNGLLSHDIKRFQTTLKRESINNFQEHLHAYFKNYPETTEEGKLKHFYNEYYLHRVGNGEDLWGRRFFWTVHPMMAGNLIDLFREMPLEYASYSTFRSLLRKIDPKLLQVDIYNDQIKLNSRFYFIKDLKISLNHNKIKLYYFVKTKFNLLINIYKKIKSIASKKTNLPEDKNSIPNKEEIENAKFIEQYFDINELLKYFKNQKLLERDRLFSLIIYLLEIEKKYRDKVVD